MLGIGLTFFKLGRNPCSELANTPSFKCFFSEDPDFAVENSY